MDDLHSQLGMFWTLFSNLIRWIQLCDKKNLTVVDYSDKKFIELVVKKLLSSSKARLITFFKTRLINFI